jgi:hypothetical protein
VRKITSEDPSPVNGKNKSCTIITVQKIKITIKIQYKKDIYLTNKFCNCYIWNVPNNEFINFVFTFPVKIHGD